MRDTERQSDAFAPQMSDLGAGLESVEDIVNYDDSDNQVSDAEHSDGLGVMRTGVDEVRHDIEIILFASLKLRHMLYERRPPLRDFRTCRCD